MNLFSFLLLFLGLSGPPAAPSADAAPHAFAEIDVHYQAIRLALLADSGEGVAENARAMARIAGALRRAPTAAKAGVPPAGLELVTGLLPDLVKRAEALAESEGIRAQREALKILTQPLVRWHEQVEGGKPRVAYCSMERGAWFQPDGVLGNPYGGQAMPRCGTFVTN